MREKLSGALVLALLVALMLWSVAHAGKQRPAWGSCKDTSQCTVERDECNGPIGINFDYREQYKEWRDKVAPTVKCALMPWPKTVCLSCVNSRCSINGE